MDLSAWTRISFTATLTLALLHAAAVEARPHCKGEVLNPTDPDVKRAVEDYALLKAIEEARTRLGWDKKMEKQIHSWNNYMRHVAEGLRNPKDKLAEAVFWAGSTMYNRKEVDRLWRHKLKSNRQVYQDNRNAYRDAAKTYASSMLAPKGKEQQWFDIFMDARKRTYQEATELIKHSKKHNIPLNFGVASDNGLNINGSLNDPPSHCKAKNMLSGARNFQLLSSAVDTYNRGVGSAREWVRQEALAMGLPRERVKRCLDHTSWEYLGFDDVERRFVDGQLRMAAAIRCGDRRQVRSTGTVARTDSCLFAQKLLKHCIRRWRPDRARCNRKNPHVPTPPVKVVAPPRGGHWNLIKTVSKKPDMGKHDCYKYGGSGGEGSATYIIQNVCVKPHTKYTGTVTWTRPPAVLRPGQEIEINGSASTSAFDSRFSQGTHLSVKADFPTVPCGYRHVMGIPIGHIGATSGTPKRSALKAKFKVRWKGPYGLAKDGTFGIFFCSPSHHQMYLYRWVPAR